MPPRCPAPNLDHERSILASGYQLLASIDEVGRGAIAGPVSVGVVLLARTTVNPPEGVRDSKELSAARRQTLAPQIREWALGCAVGHVSADVIDEIGIMAALALAARHGLDSLAEQPDVILLDGSHNWMATACNGAPVHTKVRADSSCAGVGAASVLAKVERDGLMTQLATEFPDFGWEKNKGYATAAHMEAVRTLGATLQHRRSWNLPGLQGRLGER